MPVQQTEISGFRAHFRNPRGFLGRIAGLLMVITNRRINRFVVEMLDVQARDRVLEIGFGPGRPDDARQSAPSSTVIPIRRISARATLNVRT
jgi:hypothetical protein